VKRLVTLLLVGAAVSGYCQFWRPKSHGLLERSVVRNLNKADELWRAGDQLRAMSYAGLVALPQSLTYCFLTDGVEFTRGQQLQEWAERGIQAWNDTAITQLIPASDRNSAQVTIEFKDVIRGTVGRYAGYATTHRLSRASAGGVTVELSADVEISNRAPGGRYTNERQVQKAVMHELGHVLGLEDISAASKTMGPVGSNRTPAIDANSITALSEADTRAKAIIGAPAVYAGSTGYVPKVFTFAEPQG
jgi:predicted Zn-dependent protease